ncbi:MAG TPA: DUF4097 family beta strand repeat-containing protein [Bryobacteraceae bacterium]
MRQTILIGAALAALACAQDAQQDTEKVTMPFSNPSGPHKLVVDALQGSVTVKGYAGQEVVIEYTPGPGRGRGRRTGRNPAEPPPAGMHRIGGNRDLDVTESSNTVTVKTGVFAPVSNVVIQTPADTSVTVKTLAGRSIDIDNVSGEIDANNFSGAVNITNASGAVVAHSMNGKVTASLNRVPPDKMMSFSTFNGDVDVTLPADAKATLKMRDDNGDIFSDFDVKLEAQSPAQATQEKDKNGRTTRRVRVDGAQTGSINGGGPEIQFTTYNGRIMIHKK